MREIEVEIPEKLVSLLFGEKTRYRVAWGGRGSAKSWSFARALLMKGMKDKLRILCGREVQKSLKDSVKKLLDDQIIAMGLTGDYKSTEKGIVGVNGTEFMFSGLQDHTSDSVKSFESIDICWLEEAQSISKKSMNILIPTIRKPGSEIWASFNPLLMSDEAYQRFIVSPPEDSLVVCMSWRDNPWFSEEMEAERLYLKHNDPEAYLNVWEGQCLQVGDNQLIGMEQAYKASERQYTTREIAHAPRILGVDVARYGGDRSVIVRRQGLVAFEPKVFRGMDNMALASMVMQEKSEWKPDAIFIDAGRGEGVIDRLRQLGVDVVEVNFGGRPNDPKYQNKRAEMWNEMATWVKDKGMIPRNTELIEDLAAPTYMFSNSTNRFQVESKEMLKARGAKSPDIADALALTFADNVIPQEAYGSMFDHGTKEEVYQPYQGM